MSEENPISAEGIGKLWERHGLASVLLMAVLYVGWTSFLQPAAQRYMVLLDSVTESNKTLSEVIKELKQGIVTIGEANSTAISEMNSKLDIVTDLSRQISRDLAEMASERRTSPPQWNAD